jgi:hypothetical protein
MIRRRSTLRAEDYILEYEFPPHIRRRIRRRFAHLDEAGLEMVERGLREWLVCCAWRRRTLLGMPSRVVDEAWHEFILDSIAYTKFCNVAFGDYLHHTPDDAMETPMADALHNTVRAWDRSRSGEYGESVLWDLDEKLRIPDPIGISGLQVSASRSGVPASGSGGAYMGACGGGGGGADGGGVGADGGGGGGGCGGGGCGGGG